MAPASRSVVRGDRGEVGHGDGGTMDSLSPRDELGQNLGFRQDEQTRVWWGTCPGCADRKASVGSTGFTCPSCGPSGFNGASRESVDVGAVMVRLADVEPETVDWLWPGRIPCWRLTVLDGDPGLGKSAVTIDLASRVTRYARMPDGTRGLWTARGVVLIGVEDGLADTVRPRLDAAGADVERVVALEAVRGDDGRPRLPTIADTQAIAETADGVDAALLIIDPLSAFLGRGVDGHRDTDVRQALASLAVMAEKTGLAVLVVRHLSKSGGANPIYRGGGSIAIIAAARSGLLLARDPDDDDLRVLATTKCNLAPPQQSLSLRLDASGGALKVEWLGTSERSAGDLLTVTDSEERSARGEAIELLQTELEDGPKSVPALRAAASSAGIGWRTVERAKAALRVESVKRKVAGGGWVWRLPTEDRQGGWRTSEKEDVAVFDLGARLSQKPGVGGSEGRQAQSLAALDASKTVLEVLGAGNGGEVTS